VNQACATLMASNSFQPLVPEVWWLVCLEQIHGLQQGSCVGVPESRHLSSFIM
jgi:hypothetical protein